jgi:hypothetical protein
MKLAPVIFSQNSPAGLTMIRFVVDMTLETVSANGVHVAGNFQSNDPATHRMYSFKNNKYEIISYMVPGNYTYKFYNGNTVSNSETVPAGCSSSGDRTINQTNDIFLNSVCYSSCSNCYPSTIVETKTSDLKIFPNPMSLSTMIQFGDHENIHHLSVTDITGRLVFYKSSVLNSSYLLSNNGLHKGVYIIKVETKSGKKISSKLIVE